MKNSKCIMVQIYALLLSVSMALSTFAAVDSEIAAEAMEEQMTASESEEETDYEEEESEAGADIMDSDEETADASDADWDETTTPEDNEDLSIDETLPDTSDDAGKADESGEPAENETGNPEEKNPDEGISDEGLNEQETSQAETGAGDSLNDETSEEQESVTGNLADAVYEDANPEPVISSPDEVIEEPETEAIGNVASEKNPETEGIIDEGIQEGSTDLPEAEIEGTEQDETGGQSATDETVISLGEPILTEETQETDAVSYAILSAPTQITEQPEDQAAAVGEKITLKVAAEGDNLSYQWQYRDPGKEWKYLKTTRTSLSVTVTETIHGRQYRCIVKGDGGKAYTDPAEITVLTRITADPVSQYGSVGQKITLKVAATGSNLGYQWEYMDPGTEWKTLKTTSTSLSLTVTAAINGRQYRSIVTGDGGSEVSRAATIRLKPYVTRQPLNQKGPVGTKVTLAVEAAGTNLAYRWQYKDPGAEWKYLKSTTPSLSFSIVSSIEGREYRCIIAGDGGKAYTDPAKISVTTKITKQPVLPKLDPDKKAVLQVGATGHGLSYRWQYKEPGGEWKYLKTTTPSLSITASLAIEGRQYRCIVSGTNGKAYSDPAEVQFRHFMVKFLNNGGQGTDLASLNCCFNLDYNLPMPDAAKNGYYFKEWNTRADGKGSSYKSLASYRNMGSGDGATVNLYAIWQKASSTEISYAKQVFDLVNKERRAEGLSDLIYDDSLCAVAMERARECQAYFTHTRPNGEKCFTLFTKYGLSYSYAGENIAMGQRTPAEVMDSWMNSTGHRNNILGSVTRIGIGCVYSGGEYFWVQCFMTAWGD